MPASNHVVVKVDIATNKVTTVSSKSFATSLWIGSSSRNVYVLSVYGDPSPPGGALTVIDDATNSLHVVTSKLLTDPMGLAVLGSHVWVISSSTLSSATSPNPNFQLVRVTP
jgi:hypothetical protein